MPKHILQQKILNTTLHTNDKKWLTNFLLDRRAQTLCNNTNSSKQSPSFKQTPPLLGVTYDAHMPFSQHTKNITTKATKRLKALKTLTSFDQQKASLTILYKTTLNYASPSWCPSFSKTNRKALQLVKNKALRTIIGCTQTTPIDHLHSNHPLYIHSPSPRNKNNHLPLTTRLYQTMPTPHRKTLTSQNVFTPY